MERDTGFAGSRSGGLAGSGAAVFANRRRRRSSRRGVNLAYRTEDASFRRFRLHVLSLRVSIQIFSTFACREFDDGTRYLKVDYSIDCNASSRDVYWYYAVLMGFVYPVGIPLLYYVQLRNAQKKTYLDPGQKALVNKKAWKRQDNNKKEKVEFQMDEEGAEPPAGEEGWGAWEVIESMTEEEVRVNRGSYPCWTHKTLTLNERRLCSAPSTSGRSSKRSMFR